MKKRVRNEREMASALREERPALRRDFGLELRERLLERDSRAHRPLHLPPMVGAYVAAGLLLLLLAALGAGGAGPFGS